MYKTKSIPNEISFISTLPDDHPTTNLIRGEGREEDKKKKTRRRMEREAKKTRTTLPI